ncbi:hypothetical protein C7T35_21930 [Variovorax sp. WS11]|uniref:hypothetical protein n=1 Tax=Variovorax sp. WS11 TaxID=1105204 RepID=UPI000D0DAC66|nr:hypothetical protein [Variovorax sp. WS11]NDZ18980.1 hypothetical protein [Variovorax sp. WS11]PSL82487.1 hypothetical protein C7T35_21930 [Variovorax sp. WS11]
MQITRGQDGLLIVDRRRPDPKPTEILARSRTVGVNRTDRSVLVDAATVLPIASRFAFDEATLDTLRDGEHLGKFVLEL